MDGAAAGAIEKVVIDGDVRCSVIADAQAVGLCGSGLIDAVAELLRVGLITPEGRLLTATEAPAGLSPALLGRLCNDPAGQPAFLLAGGGGSAGAPAPVTLTQRDVRELQLASGAIRAGILILLKQAGLRTIDLKRVLIAGGFGSFIRRNHAQRIGLLPGDIEHQRIQHVGNASLAGARYALLSMKARQEAERLARMAKHVELSQDLEFQMLFAEAMIFPEE